jgi:hypothetical protein
MSAVTDSRVSAMLSDTNQIRCVIDTFVQHYVIKFVNDLHYLKAAFITIIHTPFIKNFLLGKTIEHRLQIK